MYATKLMLMIKLVIPGKLEVWASLNKKVILAKSVVMKCHIC